MDCGFYVEEIPTRQNAIALVRCGSWTRMISVKLTKTPLNCSNSSQNSAQQ